VHDILHDLGGSSFFRGARSRRMLARAAVSGKVTTDDIAGILADHASYPHAICRHEAAGATDDERSESIYSVILDLDDRSMSIAPGPPCTAVAYSTVSMEELFA
jgi:isopenicillin-N N-acyltransferase-like protein